MKHIRGYVCVATVDTHLKALYGKVLHNTPHSYDSLTLNGIQPYDTLNQAIVGFRELQNRDTVLEVKLAELEMDIAQSEEEVRKHFQDGMPLIVVGNRTDRKSHPDFVFFGESTEESWVYPLPCGYLTSNNFKTISSLDQAMRISAEVIRQGQMPSTIATFRLTYLNPQSKEQIQIRPNP